MSPIVIANGKLPGGGGGRESAGKGRSPLRLLIRALGLPSQVPPLGRAIVEPQTGRWSTGPPDEIAQPVALEEFDQRLGTIDFAE